MLSGKTILSECGGDPSYLGVDRLPKIQSVWSPMFQQLKLMKETLISDLYTRTSGIHIVELFGPEGKICVIEDIGRHNVLDKSNRLRTEIWCGLLKDNCNLSRKAFF